jgi:hypothetical protein
MVLSALKQLPSATATAAQAAASATKKDDDASNIAPFALATQQVNFIMPAFSVLGLTPGQPPAPKAPTPEEIAAEAQRKLLASAATNLTAFTAERGQVNAALNNHVHTLDFSSRDLTADFKTKYERQNFGQILNAIVSTQEAITALKAKPNQTADDKKKIEELEAELGQLKTVRKESVDKNRPAEAGAARDKYDKEVAEGQDKHAELSDKMAKAKQIKEAYEGKGIKDFATNLTTALTPGINGLNAEGKKELLDALKEALGDDSAAAFIRAHAAKFDVIRDNYGLAGVPGGANPHQTALDQVKAMFPKLKNDDAISLIGAAIKAIMTNQAELEKQQKAGDTGINNAVTRGVFAENLRAVARLAVPPAPMPRPAPPPKKGP